MMNKLLQLMREYHSKFGLEAHYPTHPKLTQNKKLAVELSRKMIAASALYAEAHGVSVDDLLVQGINLKGAAEENDKAKALHSLVDIIHTAIEAALVDGFGTDLYSTTVLSEACRLALAANMRREPVKIDGRSKKTPEDVIAVQFFPVDTVTTDLKDLVK